MPKLTPEELMIFLTQIVALLGFAKILGELAKKLKQPAVVGELLAGIILGPTILGNFWPETFQHFFKGSGGAGVALDGLNQFAILMLMFVVGLEVEVDKIAKQGKAVAALGLSGIIIPFIIGFGGGWLMYPMFQLEISQPLFALFLGAALSISALPVIARVLMDFNLLKTKTGSLIIATSTVNDVIGWILFTIVLASAGHNEGGNIYITVGATIVLSVLSVTLFRKFCNWLLEKTYQTFKSTASVVGVVLILMFMGAILTGKLGMEAIFGPFLIGLSVGGSQRLTHQVRETFMQFVGFVLAPLFFASVGLKVNFAANFDIIATLIIIVLAFVSKFMAAWVGGKIAGLSKNDTICVGLGIAARGGMGIILAVISFNAHLVSAPLFTALVTMAVVTSMTTGLIKNFFVPSDEVEKKMLELANHKV